MKKSISTLLGLMLFLLFSINISAQSADEELDQVELMKQFIGTWKCEIGNDTILYQKVEPLGKGAHISWEWRGSGNVYNTAKSIMGFSDQGEIIMSHLWQNGTMSSDIGRFVSKNKMMMERFPPGSIHANALWELTFTDTDHTWVLYGRGSEITWDALWTNEWKMLKVKD